MHVDCLFVVLDERMFSHKRYGPGTVRGACGGPKAVGPGAVRGQATVGRGGESPDRLYKAPTDYTKRRNIRQYPKY